MNVLIVAKYWDSSAGIGALRPMKVAKYLLREGHNVAVICGTEYFENEYPCKDLNDLRNQHNYVELPAFTYSGIVKKENNYYTRHNEKKKISSLSSSNNGNIIKKPAKQRLTNKLKWYLYKTVYNSIKVRNTVTASLGAINRLPWKPDIILSSYAPEEVHFLARRIKKHYPEAFWIADFRDPMANSTNQKPYEFRYRLKREKFIFRESDAVTVVSKTWCDEFQAMGCKNSYTIFSGFDREDFLDLIDSKPVSDKLVLTYTGSLYPELSDLKPLFRAFGELIREHYVNPSNLRFVYAGAHGEEFLKQAKSINAEVEIINHGLIPRTESLSLLKESDILLHALFCTPGLRGIITGKLGEYWIAGKPILAVVTGTVRADEFISIIERSKTGFVYDGTNEIDSFNKLQAYILEVYNKKQAGEKIPYSRNEDFISDFDYKVIARKILKIVNLELITNE